MTKYSEESFKYVYEAKSVNVTFTLRRNFCLPVTLKNIKISQTNHVKYLGSHLNKLLTWQKLILLYKAMPKPVWTYGN